MSSQKGNVSRTRKPKHQNSSAFKNDLHDTSRRTKMIKGLSPEGLCQRCKEIIEWKIKYKKYKPLKQPATCVCCGQKAVKRAYYTVCQACSEKNEVCAKCNTKKEIVLKVGLSEKEKQEQDQQIQFEMRQLTERQRRKVLRFAEKGGDVNLATKGMAAGGGWSDDDDDDDNSEDEKSENGDDVCDIERTEATQAVSYDSNCSVGS